MDKYEACTYCRNPAGMGHKGWCINLQSEVAPAQEPISSEASTTIDPQKQKALHETADSLLDFATTLEQLRSLCGTHPSEFWPIVMMAEISRISAQLQSGMALLTRSSNGLPDLAQPPAPSLLHSMLQAASDADTPDESLRQYSSDETDAEKAFNLLLTRLEELQEQLHSQRRASNSTAVYLQQRLTALEERFSPAPHSTSDMMPTVDFITPSAQKTAGSATSSSASTRSTSKRSKPRKRTKAGSVSSSAKRKPAKRGAILSSRPAKRSVATRARSSLNGA